MQGSRRLLRDSMNIDELKESLRLLLVNAIRETGQALTEDEIKGVLIELVESFVDEVDLGYKDGYPRLQ